MRQGLARRLGFWRAAAGAGVPAGRRLVSVIAAAVGVGLSGYAAFALDNPLLAAAILLVIATLTVGEGAFQIATVLLDRLTAIQRAEQTKVEARAAHRAWTERVKTFLDVRDALRPPEPGGRSLQELLMRKMDQPEPDDAQEARQAHDRQTVAEYIRDYRAEGLELFERAVADGRIVPALREKFEHPRTVYDIRELAHTIEIVEQRIT
jgi:hypothetical protein